MTHLRPKETKQKNGVGDFVGTAVGLGVGGVGRGVGGGGVGCGVGVGVGALVGEQLPPKRLQEWAKQQPPAASHFLRSPEGNVHDGSGVGFGACVGLVVGFGVGFGFDPISDVSLRDLCASLPLCVGP